MPGTGTDSRVPLDSITGSVAIEGPSPWCDVANLKFAGGAKGNGDSTSPTDDTAAFQAATDYAHSNPNGGLVFYGPFNFRINGTLRTYPNVGYVTFGGTLSGVGASSVTPITTLSPDSVINVLSPKYRRIGTWDPVAGTGDASAAILQAVNDAAALTTGFNTGQHSRGTVYFPAAIYLVLLSSVLTPTNASYMPGILFQGAGMWASILRFGALSGSSWFYDNGATMRTAFNVFENLGFEGMDPAAFAVYTDIPTNANFMRFYSTNNEQGMRFVNCRAYYFTTMFDMEGTNNAAEMFHFGCLYQFIKSTFYLLNNAQSFDHEFHSCQILPYGDVFVLGAGGGGAIKMFGGAITMLSTGSNHYFINMVSGPLQNPMEVIGLYMECLGDFTKLINQTASGRVHFSDCFFLSSTVTDMAGWVTTINGGVIDFSDCTFQENQAGRFMFTVANNFGPFGDAGTITFRSCALNTDWSDRCAIASQGGIRAMDCRGMNYGGVGSAHWAHDFDLIGDEPTPGLYTGWTSNANGGGSPSHGSIPLKSCFLKLPTDFWPITGGGQTLKLPRNAIIKNIHLRKPGGGASGGQTTFIVSRLDKSGSPHLVSDVAANSAPSQGDITNYFYNVGTTVNERTLIVYAGTPQAGGTFQGGFVMVEYY